MVFGLLLLATALGAVVMWRVVHRPSQPPALPIWVSSLLVVGGAIWIAAAVVAGQLTLIVSAVLISVTFLIQLVMSLRNRAASGQ
jgi:hypothetical protein